MGGKYVSRDEDVKNAVNGYLVEVVIEMKNS